MRKLISFENLKTFLEDIKKWFQPKIDKVDKKLWMGEESELEDAIANGLVDETTTIVITGGESDSNMYQFCTYSDILALFPQYM